MVEKAKSALRLLSSMLKDKYQQELKDNIKSTTKDSNGFVRVDYKLLTNI